MYKIFLFIPLAITLIFARSYSQPRIADEIVAVVGDKKIQYSDIEKQYYQLLAQGMNEEEGLRCKILEELLNQMLLVNQAEIDSIEVNDLQVEMELDNRMQYYINQVGSEEKLEQLFQKTILEMKEDFRDLVRDQILAQQMRSQITKNISITPSEVRSFYRSLPPDSLPYINAQVEVSQIVLYPSSSESAIMEVREKLLNLRQRIIEGENFATLAVLYSEDPGSASKGGDIGFASKGSLDPEYAKAAMALKPGQVSKIVESEFGFHIIQLIERSGDRIHTRHILMKPKITPEEKFKTKERMDSILSLIHADSLKFEDAARRYSMDEETRLSGGKLVNPQSGTSTFELDQFDTRDYLVINKLSPGQVSEAYETTDNKGKTIIKAVKLTNRTNPHVANIRDDYNLFKQIALQQKENDIVENWIRNKIGTTYIKIEDRYKDCDFHIKGWVK